MKPAIRMQTILNEGDHWIAHVTRRDDGKTWNALGKPGRNTTPARHQILGAGMHQQRISTVEK